MVEISDCVIDLNSPSEQPSCWGNVQKNDLPCETLDLNYHLIKVNANCGFENSAALRCNLNLP